MGVSEVRRIALVSPVNDRARSRRVDAGQSDSFAGATSFAKPINLWLSNARP
jgi:hypothetical protein